MIEKYCLEDWVGEAKGAELEFRQAVHTILAAISESSDLRDNMIIKGGILLAIRYRSRRFTRDIDFSSPKKLNEIAPEHIVDTLSKSLSIMVECLGYELDCQIQGWKISPAKNPNPTFPNIELNIGYAYKGDAKHRRLMKGNSPDIVSIDYSLNEKTPYVENLTIGNVGLAAYSLVDIIAEKYRAVLQQAQRNRQRRQDIFDLFFLLEANSDLDGEEKFQILSSLITKAESREVYPKKESLDAPEIYERAKAEYSTLTSEIEGELPNFDEIYEVVKEFYQSLDWPE